jgi:hypothetical protein
LASLVAYIVEATTIEGGQMTNFLALYRGDTVASSRIVALTADPQLVQDFATRFLDQLSDKALVEDPALSSVEDGRRRALRVVANEGNKKGPNLLAEEPGQTQKGLHDSIPS